MDVFAHISLCASVLMVVALTFERHFAITSPHQVIDMNHCKCIENKVLTLDSLVSCPFATHQVVETSLLLHCSCHILVIFLQHSTLYQPKGMYQIEKLPNFRLLTE